MPLARTPNNIEILAAKSDVTQQAEYLSSHNSYLNVGANITANTIGLATASNQTDGTQVVKVSNAIVTVPFDYIGAAYPTTSQEVYTYKTGGAGGTKVATITVNYSDAVTKQIITSIART